MTPRARDELGRPLPPGATGSPVPVGEPSLAEAQRLLELGRPFEAHEVLEALWKAAPAPQRELWRALAQVCVGLTHLRRGNRVGAVALLQRGSAGLRALPCPPPVSGVDVSGVCRWAEQVSADPAAAVPPLFLGTVMG
jgi:hypothetical protein